MFPNSMGRLPATGHGGSRVSILMRTLDRPVLLARAMSGVLGQTYPDWHLSIVNDGGAPGPVDALVEEYRTAFAGRVDVRHHPRGLGMEAAANAALDASTGGFVCVHDDDDSWHPEFLDACTKFLDDPAHARFAAVITHTTVVFERIEEDGVVERSRSADTYNPLRVDYASMLRRNLYPPISQMIRRQVVDAIGPFNAEMPVLGDWDYNLRILAQGDIGVVPRRLAYYCQRDDGEGGSYGNSVIGGAARHDEMRTLYRNSLVRRVAEDAPASLGTMHVLLDEAGRNQDRLLAKISDDHSQLMQRSYDTDEWAGWRHDDLRRRLERVEGELAGLRASLEAIRALLDSLVAGLGPFRWLARRLLLRRGPARRRGQG